MTVGSGDSARASLARFLKGEPGEPPSLEALRRATLSPLAHVRLPDHPDAEALRSDHALQSARHLMLRAHLAPLLTELDRREVRTLVFKGFHLAELVYPSPGLRVYADVDLVMAEAALPGLLEAATATGWRVAWRLGEADDPTALRSAGYLGHEMAQLEQPGAGFRVDVHRRPVHNLHNRLPAGPLRERLSTALWQNAVQVEMAGAKVLVPSPVDAAVFGVMLNRSWGSDRWWVKPRDYADLQALTEAKALTRDDVLARARDLDVARTVAAYLERCDPWLGVLDLSEPKGLQAARLDALAGPEQGSRLAADAWFGLVDLPCDVAALVSGYLWLRRAERVTERGAVPAEDEARETGADTGVAGVTSDGSHSAGPGPAHFGNHRPLGRQAWRTLRRGLMRAVRLRGLSGERAERTAHMAAYLWLSRRGEPVRLLGDPANPTLTYDGRPLALSSV
ncbi:MAG TPA: nucleotidyltransferase family protein, partial [Trueperaceae bacterium]